jgi:biopolymer transport protein ExbD
LGATTLKFQKKIKITGGIPTASLPDIVFMLLIFFMVSTVLKESHGLQVLLPDAQKVVKLPGKNDVAVIWVDKAGHVSIDDHIIADLTTIRNIMYNKCIDDMNPLRIVSLRIDKEVEMKLVTDIHEELRECAGAALNVNYSARMTEN